MYDISAIVGGNGGSNDRNEDWDFEEGDLIWKVLKNRVFGIGSRQLHCFITISKKTNRHMHMMRSSILPHFNPEEISMQLAYSRWTLQRLIRSVRRLVLCHREASQMSHLSYQRSAPRLGSELQKVPPKLIFQHLKTASSVLN